MIPRKNMIQYTVFVIENNFPSEQLDKLFRDKYILINDEYMNIYI